MLILSRKVSETVVFPHLGITVHLVRIRGQAVQLGIDAPAHLAVLRGELLTSNSAPITDPVRQLAHALANKINKINLQLHIFRRLQEQGKLREAEETLDEVFAGLKTLDREWVGEHFLANPTKPGQQQSTCKALVVEDDDNERELLAGLLRMNGVDCYTAGDGEEALRLLANGTRPDIILLDMVMPRCDGVKTLQEIRRDPNLRNLRVFSISAISPEQVGLSTGPEGLDGWFPKPLNPGRLWQTISATPPSHN